MPDTSTPARSISTTRGDAGQTGLAGGIRVSKASSRVDAFGTVDELNAAIAFARSITGAGMPARRAT